MGFEKFDEAGSGRGRPAGADPMISIRKSGSIGVNQAAIEEYFVESDGAVMYFDEEQNQVGIEPVDDKDADEAAYTITKTDSGGTIAPKAFLERFELIPEVTTQYDPELSDDDLVVIDLDDPTGTHGSPDDGDDEEEAESE
ncbi:hypothetical protein [Halorarius halobius]|uniref:hypothetical protein n=1 Tax=Halorarius halobius TaxID=2962671 RepID=UPI0020CFCCB9|nr:hypothetical protein [Halorarius halobius]